MKLNDFVQLASKIQNMPLPGKEAHYKMSSEARIRHIKKFNDNFDDARKAAVLACFYPNIQEDVQLLLTLRHSYNGVHSNQISFPGGKSEKVDVNLTETALRETEEEVGIHRSNVEVVKELSKVFIPPSNFLVQPYLGYVKTTPDFTIQEYEVATLIEVAFADLMDDHFIEEVPITTSYAKNIHVPAFNFYDNIVWGATGMILNEVKTLFRQAM
ncbi:coenzyme A pyrophosphatase [Neptunitalea chrysea]|uniref:Coenzyme A pyrophosphatase n=1 Tax=Neptunitalea chrysea TaxID=1647581 RepID=A0A9W6B4E3_9FLAO|nr:CoA pyrophosphatase [Neptunitalea chrysea]GLB51632.1 coenzyme A pyrophosphatase [Neptunitalea chrysea]